MVELLDTRQSETVGQSRYRPTELEPAKESDEVAASSRVAV